MREEPKKIYQERIEALDLKQQQIKKKDYLLLTLKLVMVFTGIWYLFRILKHKSQQDLLIFAAVFVCFVIVSIIHERIMKQKKLNKVLKDINLDELRALEGEFLEVDPGSGYGNESHRYAADLDIFGERSLFHFLNRTSTLPGEDMLADYLSRNVNCETVVNRQQAVKDLKDRIDFRQRIIARGRGKKKKSKESEIIKMVLDQKPLIQNRIALIGLNHIFPLLTAGFLILAFFNFPLTYFFALFLFQLIVNVTKIKRVTIFYKLISRTAKILNSYAKIISEIEDQDFVSSYLKELHKKLFSKQRPASLYIKKLSGIIHLMDLRLSAIHFFVNNILFWDLNLMHRFEKWRKIAGEDIREWFEVIGNMEALSSLACLYFNNPDWELPELQSKDFYFSGKNIGHPLIHKRERICNDFAMDKNNRIVFVTGPNMAGKSTFLRTIGINVVLAYAGSVVCGKEFIIPQVYIYTSMKVSDSLDKHLSLFYAELKRLKKILDAISKDKMVFFLIDEMLKGTNELDRQKGAIALLKQLLVSNIRGIVATHDIELTKFEKSHPVSVENFHFDGYVKGDKLLFDYRLKAGICESFNALILMKKMGIKI